MGVSLFSFSLTLSIDLLLVIVVKVVLLDLLLVEVLLIVLSVTVLLLLGLLCVVGFLLKKCKDRPGLVTPSGNRASQLHPPYRLQIVSPTLL